MSSNFQFSFKINFLSAFGIGGYNPTTSLPAEICWGKGGNGTDIFIIIIINFWLCWVFDAMSGLSLVVVSRGHSLLQCPGLVAPWHVGSSQTRDRTHVPCINRQTSNHWTTREAQTGIFTVSINVENCVRPGIDSVLLESITENHTYRSRHMQIHSLKICREWLRTVIEPSHGLPCSCYTEQKESIWLARLDF